MALVPKRVEAMAGGTGNINGKNPGEVTAGTTFIVPTAKQGTLSALVTVLAETNTLTIEAVWQVTNDNVNWYIIVPPNNPANVVLATGTAGADAAVTVVMSAPEAVYGFFRARIAIINRVAIGTAADTYTFTYNYISETEVF